MKTNTSVESMSVCLSFLHKTVIKQFDKGEVCSNVDVIHSRQSSLKEQLNKNDEKFQFLSQCEITHFTFNKTE